MRDEQSSPNDSHEPRRQPGSLTLDRSGGETALASESLRPDAASSEAGLPDRRLGLALGLALALHGALLPFTFGRTYDAWVHIFFADHYRRSWFDHWEPRWYTGFTMTSYPPGSHQLTALLSNVMGLRAGFVLVQLIVVLLVVLGSYRFSRIWVSRRAAGYAALLAALSSSIIEAVHVFGQLPTIVSLGLLLNALPHVARWLEDGRKRELLSAWSLCAATTAAHHVTTLFGAVFFVGPVIATALLEAFGRPLPDEPEGRPVHVDRRTLIALLARRARRLLPVVLRAAVFGIGLIALLLTVVLPYWLWSRGDPITQVPIPHASRDSFLENPAAGLVFWIVPWGMMLFALPYALYKGFATRRRWPLAASMLLLFVLGTGGTTPIPRFLLRGAFDILTLDRFTFWSTILVLPLAGAGLESLRHGRLGRLVHDQLGQAGWRLGLAAGAVMLIAFAVFVANLTQYRRLQPPRIDIAPIVSFLDKDEHWRWRYLTLGFGDQMAWLAANTRATTVDGNYHSARRLPELTTTPVERLEGAKFRGVPGIGSLQQFLAVPEKYNLKFVFSNDAFYDPLLYFSGWHKLQRLENGIQVWERADIPPLPEILPRREIPLWQRALWGLLPPAALLTALLVAGARAAGGPLARLAIAAGLPELGHRLAPLARVLGWPVSALDRWLLAISRRADGAVTMRARPWQPWLRWAGRLRWPRPAQPRRAALRLILLLAMLAAAGGGGIWWRARAVDSPERAVLAWYDDLDFRRFEPAWQRIDPATRPDFEQFMLERSVEGGLVDSFGKLDALTVTVEALSASQAVVSARASYVTSLSQHEVLREHGLVRSQGRWWILPEAPDPSQPRDPFLRRPSVDWLAQGRRAVTSGTTAFADILDRPALVLRDARLVEAAGALRVVGEVLNSDVDPADLTITAALFAEGGEELAWYNAQTVMLHKLLPKESTPFRVDFEGVAGATLAEAASDLAFRPEARSPLRIARAVADFAVFPRAVVTARDLRRELGVQELRARVEPDGAVTVYGEVRNLGTREVIVPQILAAAYDEQGRVAWVEARYLDAGVRAQRARAFSLRLPAASSLRTVRGLAPDPAAAGARALGGSRPAGADAAAQGSGVGEGRSNGGGLLGEAALAAQRLPLPPGAGYHRVMLIAHGMVVGSEGQ